MNQSFAGAARSGDLDRGEHYPAQRRWIGHRLVLAVTVVAFSSVAEAGRITSLELSQNLVKAAHIFSIYVKGYGTCDKASVYWDGSYVRDYQNLVFGPKGNKKFEIKTDAPVTGKKKIEVRPAKGAKNCTGYGSIVVTVVPAGLRFSQRVKPAKTKVAPVVKPVVKGPRFRFGLSSRTTLEVRRFSGEFTQWGNSLTINTPGKVAFRWGTSAPSVTSARWQVSGKPFPSTDKTAHLAKVLKSGFLSSVPSKGKTAFFQIDFTQIIKKPPPPAGKRYYVRVVPMKSARQPADRSYRIITITHRKAAPAGRIHLDSVRVLSISPAGGTLQGPPASAKIGMLNDTNSVEIRYRYDLNTEEKADIRQWLLLKNGSVAPNNFWGSRLVKNGVGTATTRATIKCENKGQKQTLIMGIKYILRSSGNVLAEGKKSIPGGITFKCPTDTVSPSIYLKITKLSPESGTIFGPKEGKKMSSGNSVLIRYEYKFPSGEKASIRQWALRENGQVEPLNLWTFSPAVKGIHTTQTRLTVRCKSANQGPRRIRGIKYGIYSGGKVLFERVKPVYYNFICK